MKITDHLRTWTARLAAAKAMQIGARGRQAEIDGCRAAIMELGMVRDGSTIAERKATRLDELNRLSYVVGDAEGYVTALYALLALARLEMDNAESEVSE